MIVPRLSFIDEINRDSSLACSDSPFSMAEMRRPKSDIGSRSGASGIGVADGGTVCVGVGIGANVVGTIERVGTAVDLRRPCRACFERPDFEGDGERATDGAAGELIVGWGL
jgi:hypothetical protein